jgi:hypothetical protein
MIGGPCWAWRILHNKHDNTPAKKSRALREDPRTPRNDILRDLLRNRTPYHNANQDVRRPGEVFQLTRETDGDRADSVRLPSAISEAERYFESREKLPMIYARTAKKKPARDLSPS